MATAEDRSGPLGSRTRDVMLVGLALAAGAVDAISLTVLGVFTAAVTADVVLVGIALGGGDPHTAIRAGLAVAGFGLGVVLAARLFGETGEGASRPGNAPVVLAAIAAAQSLFLIGWLLEAGRPEGVFLDLLAVVSALAMGAQTVIAGVWHTGITTTYVTGTLTLLLSEVAEAAGSRAEHRRRFGVIAAVALGATAGALLLSHAREPAAILPLVVTVLVFAGAGWLGRRR